ncbi:hypothetical protein TNCV_3457521 [Trichonephila clavipes]|nr:hypothetical protein TNCV_3457521 [Trichonephila clavipes]
MVLHLGGKFLSFLDWLRAKRLLSDWMLGTVNIDSEGCLGGEVKKHGTGGAGNVLQPPASVVSAATAHTTFGPSDLTNTYFVCTRRVFGGIGHRSQALRVRCSNH